jgi:hypothetical protein
LLRRTDLVHQPDTQSVLRAHELSQHY